MKSTAIFNILDRIDSTNNYAMQRVHEGMANHGMAWFALEQTAGKGQRGHSWSSNPGENILLSIAFQPPAAFKTAPFLFNMCIALACQRFFSALIPQNLSIKWPNDLFIGDRKAGGLLIENKYQGTHWNWAIVGIGFNVNQTRFPKLLNDPTSLQLATGKSFNAIELAKNLQVALLAAVDGYRVGERDSLLEAYNQVLYLRGQTARFRQNNIVFESTVVGVDAAGQLITRDSMLRHFEFGSLSWLL
jgi:BirA family biotin operon repressor/biotin-[acetyl-CoA-carboxylase] ligase